MGKKNNIGRKGVGEGQWKEMGWGRRDRERVSRGTGPKCSKSRDLTAIAICDSNRASQTTSDLRQCEPLRKAHCSDYLCRKTALRL